MQQRMLLLPLDPKDHKIAACVHALALFITGESERKIQYVSSVSSGYIHRLAGDFAWVLDGLRCISCAKELGVPQNTTNHLGALARCIRWGVPVEGLDVLKIATHSGVPGFGRQRLMALKTNGLGTVMEILGAPLAKLSKLISGKERAEQLTNALSRNLDDAAVAYVRTHLAVAEELGLAEKVIDCNQKIGTEYEEAVVSLLKEEMQFVVDVVDDGVRQNVPDFILSIGELQIIIECKTATKRPPLINKSDAWAVVQKAADYPADIPRITLGKPDFDETSKKKAAAATGITLVRHEVFMEGLMRVLTGRLSPPEFIQWLAQPGVTELDRLPGVPTYIAEESTE
jgi:helicase